MKTKLLGGISPTHFLRNYWQKKPLLIRGAIPGFEGLLTRDELIKLSCEGEAESRLVMQRNGKWHVGTGPFTAHAFSRLSNKNWTLLVQDVNHFLPSARELLLKFKFIPYARLDDLMVSYAPEGGGVGPHFDSYDVFLLQGMGRRLWQISAQRDKRLVADAPLKILHDFRPEQEWELEPGDMLYLPPGYAHNGVAKDACMTYSIGFRAPDNQELATQFLVYLQDNTVIDGIYSDPHLHLQPHPARISRQMLRQIGTALNKIKWSEDDVERFTGMYLTEPKPHVFFTPPPHPMSRREFDFRVRKDSLKLNLKSRMLCSGTNIFLNGDIYAARTIAHKLSEQLADLFILQDVEEFDDETLALLYEWYTYGYVELELNGGPAPDSPMLA
ncbi:50S ribosomal protein L16 3-hydroxylase [Nitrosospira sp. Nsp2]|uniref:cupin domain-containing protein n=1 Tax=Nitrosospira sp. Nsp2 TaxID=136548 RepID=UPI000D326924|nr:cupin domain-containing protein [Nitrosospira sp. Nsp2]PTR16651.1 50S ribosomal protein L16 3-hydroxylase [Nitrosospira sp. Nsp2]